MKKIIYILLLSLFSINALADEKDKNLRFAYDVDFEMNFDNREFVRSSFTRSMTIFGARLTPAVGLQAFQKDSTSHRLMVGLDVMKDFGSGRNDLSLFNELVMYYRMEKSFGNTDMTLHAGIFPRNNMDGRYSEAFFSDSLRFYDNNLEGILLKFRRPKAQFEVGCDWMGQFSPDRRERFMIFSSGEGLVLPLLTFGYSGYMYHYANSEQVRGLVDNILLNPYARLDLAQKTGLQIFGITLGWLQALQHNRKHVGHYVFPGGAHLDVEAKKRDVAIKNTAFFGTDIMPYYNSYDEGGFKYGHDLYWGSPFYRVHDDNTPGPGLYDRLEVCYEPSIGKYVKIRVAAVFHFNGFHYSGCQQVVCLKASF